MFVMRNHLFPAALIVTLVLAGCDGSPEPLSLPGDAEIRPELLGAWTAEDEDGEVLMLQVAAFNDSEYLAIMDGTEDDMDGYFRVWESLVDGDLFANIQCVGCDDDDGFLFAQLWADDTTMTGSWVSDAFYELVKDAETSQE
ncbi:MAG: hypothetical protein HKN29_07460, partial [Rhodothermales bacterium]|nr:hypothetical protein [Rhodothermales bacterium]